ncbi:PREDICTED: serine-rich adhesin for platelets-like isoform X2 [Papilio xuthus]|uniref:Serine-rich adhesin for platelets-like isoform X2 n=1 Tax=Papilio xuthus TaxID=66420 RepID=A0AAJ6ZC24_PAPXU|nr:PREDICTED: serine-rich adhesin for platelets-like isoform X2 [Papilio xuthus]
MKRYLLRCYIVLLTQSVIIKGAQHNTNDSRHPRGRVVKLYSGPKLEPITCYNEGFLAEPTDCSLFYRCIKASRGKFTIVKFQCSPGTVYDPEIESCNHPQNTKRSECRSSRPFQFITAPVKHFNDNEIEPAVHEFPSPITTRKPIYDKQTINSELPSAYATFPTPIPIAVQNPGYGPYLPPNQIQSTIKAQTNENTPTTILQTPFPSIISTSQPKWTPTANQYGSTTTITTARLGNECVHDGFMGDTEDCRKFYRCVNDQRGGFKIFEFMCSESTIWDDHIQSCNHPWAVHHRRCGRDKSYGDFSSKDDEYYSQKNNSLNEEQLSTFESNKTEIPVTINLPLSTSHQSNYGEQINVEEDTTSNDKKNATTKIPSSQNSQEKQTYYPITEKELGYITQSYETITKTSSFKPDAVRHDTSYSTNNPNYKVTNNACTESGFMGDPQDCKKFYRCVENGRGSFIKHEFQCGEGTAWDKNIESCNHVWMVKECGDRGISNSFTSERYEPENMHTTLSNTIKDDNGNDNNGYNNWNDVDKHDISRPTTVLPVVTQIVEEPAKLNGSQEICNFAGFMGNRNNCKIFYRCVENSNGGFTKFEYLCGDGTAWDPSIEACNHVGQVKDCGYNVGNQTISSISSTESTIITTVSLVQTTVQLSDNKPLPLPPPANDDHLLDSQSNDIDKDPMKTPESSTVVNISNITVSGSNTINSCINSGFIGDNFDCKKFYRCVSNGDGTYKQYEFSCGEGTVWDPEIEACNHAWAVKKCGGSFNNQNEVSATHSTPTKITSNDFESGYSTQSYDQTQQPVQSTVDLSTNSVPVSDKGLQCQSAGFMADKNDCKRFYRCVENGLGGFDRFEFSCGEGTLWDSDIQACNHASSVKDCSTVNYNTTTSSPIKTTQTVATASVEVDKNVSGQTETESPTTIKTTPTGNNICTSDGFYGDEKDCKKFYRCVRNEQGSFLMYEFSCGEGTVWDQNIQACNHASTENEKCKGSTTTSVTKAPSSVIMPSSTETYNTTQPQESSTQGNNDLADMSNTCSAEGFYPDSKDCKKFFRCVSNGKGFIKYDFTCGEGTIWVQDIQACDHDSDNSTCSIQSVTVNEVTSTIPASSSDVDTEHKTTDATMPTKSTTSTPESSSIKEDASNIAECRSEGYFGNQENCQKFYRCVNDGKGTFVRYDYICGDGTIWDQDILTCNHPRDVTNRSCGNKTTSENTEASSQSTTSASLSTHSSSTQSITTMSTQTATSSMSTQTATTLMPTQTTTSSTTTQTVTSSTPTETATSTITTQTATSGMQTQTATPSKSTQTTTFSTSTERTTAQTPSNSGEGTSKNPTNENITCTKAGFYPHPSDCKKFYRCVDWDGDGKKFSVFHFECGEGTIWDPALDTCNYEESVYPPRNCGATQAQVNNTSQGTTTAQTTTTESTTPQQSSSDTTSTQSTLTEGQTAEQQSSTSQLASSTTTATDTTSTTMTSTDSSTTVPPTEITSTTVRPTDSTTTTSDQTTTSEQSTTDTTTTQSDKSTTTTVDTPTSENTSSTSDQTTISEQTTSTTEATISTTEQQTSTTLEPSSTEQPTTTTASVTEETTPPGSTTEQQSSTDSSTEVTNTSTSEATPTSTGSTTENTEATTQGGSTVKDCPETEDDQYLYACPTSFKRHPKYCNLFYQCIENNDNHELKIATFNCPNGTIYDESKIQCVEESKAAKKCQGAIAKNRRIKRLNLNSKETISVNENKYGCTGLGHFPFEKNEECSPAILKCEISKRGKLQGFVYRCPDNYVYWSVSRRCEPKLRIAACKYSSNQWIGRSEIPIETKNIA